MKIISPAGEHGDQCKNCNVGKELVKDTLTGVMMKGELLALMEVVWKSSRMF